MALPNKRTLTCYETVSREQVTRLLRTSGAALKAARGDEAAAAGIVALRKLLTSVQGDSLEVSYTKLPCGKKPFGRIYPKGVSLGGLCAELRHTLCQNTYLDIDMVNAHPTLLRYFCRTQGLSCPELERYVGAREAFLTSLTPASRNEAKEAVLATLYGGRPRFEALNGISREAEAAAMKCKELYPDMYEAAAKKAEVKAARGVRKDPLATLLSWVLGELESSCLLIMRDVFVEEGVIVGGNCILTFDGIMVPKPIVPESHDVNPEDFLELPMRHVESAFESAYPGIGLQITIKPMDRGLREEDLIADDEGPPDLERRTGASGASAWTSIRTYTSYRRAVEAFEASNFICYDHGAVYREQPTGPPRRINLSDFRRAYGDVSYCSEMGENCSFLGRYLKDNNARIFTDVRMVPPPLELEPDEGTYNTWGGYFASRIQTEPGPRGPAAVNFFKRHVEAVCNAEPVATEYLMKYLAHLIQKPGELPGVIVLIQGLEGCGKGLIYSLMKAVMGQEYCYDTTNAATHAFGRFSDHLENRLLILLDELELCVSDEIMHRLKGECVAELRTIECKGEAVRTVPNYVRYLIFTNKTMPVQISPSDRRFFCVGSKRPRMTPEDSAEGFAHVATPGSVRAIYEYLMSVDLTNFNVRSRPITSYHTDLADATSSLERRFFTHLLDTWKGDPIITIHTTQLYKWFRDYAGKSGASNTKVLSSFTHEVMTNLGPGMGVTRPEGSNGRVVIDGVRGCALTIDFLKLGRALGLPPVCQTAWAIYCKAPTSEGIEQYHSEARRLLVQQKCILSPHGSFFFDIGESTLALQELLMTGATGVLQATPGVRIELPPGISYADLSGHYDPTPFPPKRPRRRAGWAIYCRTTGLVEEALETDIARELTRQRDLCIAYAQREGLTPVAGPQQIFEDRCAAHDSLSTRKGLLALLASGAEGILCLDHLRLSDGSNDPAGWLSRTGLKFLSCTT